MKRNMVRRLLALVLGLSLLAGMMAGCGGPVGGDNTSQADDKTQGSTQGGETTTTQGGETTTTEGSTEYEYKTDITIRLSGIQGATNDWGSTDVIAEIKDRFGITVDCQPYIKDAWASKFSIELSDGKLLSDLYLNFGTGLAKVNEYGADGYLLPLNEYLDHMPNLAAFFEKHPDYMKACTSSDGNIYTVTQFNEHWLSLLPWSYIRTDWIENVGMKMPTNVDELYDLLVAFKEKDANGNGDPNDEIPLIFSDAYSRRPETTILAGFGIYVQTSASKPYGVIQLDDAGKVFLADTTENYKAYLKYMNKLWEEDLIYHESYTIPWAELQGMGANNVFGIAPAYMTPGDHTCYGWFAGLSSAYSDKQTIQIASQIGKQAKLMISADTQYPEEICHMIDWFFSVEGAQFGKNADISKYNPKMVEYNFNGYDTFVAVDNSLPPAGYDTWEIHRYQKRTINQAFDFISVVDEGSALAAIYNGSQDDKDLFQFVENNVETARAFIMSRVDEVEMVPAYPTVVYPNDLSTERTTLWTDINNYCRSMQAQFVTGELDIDAEWENYIAQLDKMGLPRLLEIEQIVYDSMYNK